MNEPIHRSNELVPIVAHSARHSAYLAAKAKFHEFNPIPRARSAAI